MIVGLPFSLDGVPPILTPTCADVHACRVPSSVLSSRSASRLTRREWLARSARGALGLSLAGPGLLSACGGLRDRPNILLITLDTTRRDRLGCYGYPRSTSPNLDHLASESTLYTRAYSPSNWTLPAHASLFTGKFTTSHGARFDPEGPLCLKGHLEGSPEFWGRFRARGLSSGEATLAALLRDAGYATGAVVAGPWLKRAFGLDRGFDFYDDSEISTSNGRPGSTVTPPALRWIEEQGSHPFFLFLNYFDPHFPYFPPPELAQRFVDDFDALRRTKPTELSPEQRSALYDAEICSMDQQIGGLLDGLRRLDLFDRSSIIVTADHGEMLGEHGRTGHGHRLYQEEIHIPLFMKHPRGEVAPGSSELPLQLTDLLPLILTRLDLPFPPGIQGGLAPDPGHPVVAEIYPLEFLSKDGASRAIIDGHLKYVWNIKGAHALYDLGSDPREQHNLIDQEPERAAALDDALRGYLDALPRPAPATGDELLDEETRQALESLGYT